MNVNGAELINLPSRMPRTADEWALRLRDPDLSVEERAAFAAWSADPAHRAALDQCRGVEGMAGLLKANPGLAPDLIARMRAIPRPAVAGKRQWRARMALAASAAIVAIGLFTLWPQPPAADGTIAQTRHGEQRSVSLKDGSTVQLNTDTAISYQVDGGERRVALTRGEAYFNVARDPSRPFIVTAGRAEVRVLGTQFSVRQVPNGVEVVVTEGRVSIAPDTGPLAMFTPRVELTRGNLLRLQEGGHPIRVTAIDATRATSWRTGSIHFDDMRLEDVVAEVNRYSATPFRIENEALKAQVVSGRVFVGDVDSFRFILRERFGIDSVEADGVIALR